MDEDTVTIFDTIAFKQREVRKIRVKSHEAPDENGEMQAMRCVEFEVVGDNRNWPHFVPYDDFVRANPHIKVEE